MFDIEYLAVDQEKANEGVWMPYLKGSELKIARLNNKAAEDHRVRKAVEHADVFNEGGEAAEQLAFEIETEVLAHHVLRDWEGIMIGKKAADYTPEIGIKLLSDPKYMDFREDVMRMARNRDNYREASEASATKSVKRTAAS